MVNCRMNADPPFCLNARVPCTPAFSRPCPSGAGYARSLDNAYVPGELSPGSRADSARSARQYVKHKPCPNGVDNALIFQKNFWSSKMRDFRPRTSPKMTKNTLFYIVEDDRAQLPKRTISSCVLLSRSWPSPSQAISARRFVAPITLVGFTALSVEISTKRSAPKRCA